MQNQSVPVYKSDSADDTCLMTEVKKILSGFGVVCKYDSFDAYFSNVAAMLGVERFDMLSHEYQRMFMNRYWHGQLNSLTAVGVNTIEERFCLVPNGDLSDWLNLFKLKVAPCAMVNALPVDLEFGITVH